MERSCGKTEGGRLLTSGLQFNGKGNRGELLENGRPLCGAERTCTLMENTISTSTHEKEED